MSVKPNKQEIQNFSTLIEDMAKNLGISRLDAILHHCEESGLELEVASKLISTPLKSRIREESEKDNLIKRSSKLPI